MRVIRCIKSAGLIVCILATLTVSGCATVSVNQLVGDTPDKRDEAYRANGGGLRFYRGEPYLAVSTGGDEIAVKVIYLPDKTKEYVAKNITGIGSASLTAKLDGGLILTEFGAVSDSKAAEVLAAVAGAVTADQAQIQKDGGGRGEIVTILLYKICYTSSGMISGIKPLDPTSLKPPC